MLEPVSFFTHCQHRPGSFTLVAFAFASSRCTSCSVSILIGVEFLERLISRLEAKGGRKLALQNGKVEGSEVGKNTALFLEAGVKSPLYVALCPDPPAREEREERRKDERQRGEKERERERREEREMREMRKR